MQSVANFDVSFLSDVLVKFANELLAAQSPGQAQFVVHDRKRTTAYVARTREYVTFLSATTDPLDLPKTHPGAYQVMDFPSAEQIEQVENLIVKRVVWGFQAAYQELVGSQSKDRASGLVSFDKERLISLCDNTDELVKLGETTLDLPEFPGGPTITGKK